MAEPTLSIVIGAWPNMKGLTDCLEALAPQRDPGVEVIVASTVGPSKELVSRFPWICWLETVADRLIPHLWAQGITQARGNVIAITTAHFVPASDWLSSIRQAHARLESPAIGGKIEPPRGGRAVDWASYFLRYSAYLAYDREQAIPDLAGDNASYKRAAFEAYPEILRDGFWELDFHRHLRADGKSLMFVPAIRVTQRESLGFRRFLRQRFQHGRHFGRSRVQGRSPLVRAAAVAASPLVPFLFLGKIVARVIRSGQDWGRFLYALPVLLCFLSAWSFGEAAGYLLPSGTADPDTPREVTTCCGTGKSSSSYAL